jgi:predicted amidophosphoribosyltransferase
VIARLAPITQKEINYILHNQTHITYIAVPKTKYDHTKNRDFDHAYLLAKKWQALLAYPGNVLDGCLIKTNYIRQVEHRSRHDRIAQARNSIQATDILLSRKPTSDTLCIIDDVTTTGATRDEMIRVLRPFFTGRIIFLALAH